VSFSFFHLRMSYCCLFGLAAAPFNVVVCLDTGVTFRIGLPRNVTRVWSFSRSGVKKRVATL
jgi:hypothetical protein